MKDLPLFQDRPKQILLGSCRKHKLKIQLLRDLLEKQRQYAGYARQRGINEDLDQVLNDYLELEAEE